MISSCLCFCFALRFEAIILAFGSRCVNFYLRLSLCTGRGRAISQYRHLYSGDIPSNRHPLTTSPSRQEPGQWSQVSCENTSDESFIFMMTSQELWNISNSLETWYTLHIAGNFPRLPRVSCQVQDSDLTPHDRSLQTKVPWFYWGFFSPVKDFCPISISIDCKINHQQVALKLV